MCQYLAGTKQNVIAERFGISPSAINQRLEKIIYNYRAILCNNEKFTQSSFWDKFQRESEYLFNAYLQEIRQKGILTIDLNEVKNLIKETSLGTLGDMGCFSLKDGKLVSAGEGGYILTNNKKYYTKLVNLRNHQISQNPDNSFKDVGYNYRLTNIQAYLAIESLNNIDANLSYRKHICNKFYKEISCMDNLSKLQCNSNYFSPLLLFKNNSLEIIKSLSKKKVINSVGSFGLRPVTERIAIKRYLKSINYNHRIKVTNCKNLLNRLLAIAINNNYNDIKVNTDIREIKGIINE